MPDNDNNTAREVALSLASNCTHYSGIALDHPDTYMAVACYECITDALSKLAAMLEAGQALVDADREYHGSFENRSPYIDKVGAAVRAMEAALETARTPD
ncbi:hypothetical protein LCGC14_1520650 [marine sediment metagenome]|uniref:Uncharacterized protein n=1 Tax=marine sediment metagenome TaxID=412755 RepID=A0A0F9LED3_9ZZZZ